MCVYVNQENETGVQNLCASLRSREGAAGASEGAVADTRGGRGTKVS